MNFTKQDFYNISALLKVTQNELLDHYRKQVIHLEEVVETTKKIYEDSVIELKNTRFVLSRLEESANNKEKKE